MYLTFIPHGVKMFLAGIMEIVLVVAVVYFLVRFALGFFIKEKDEPSPEIKAIEEIDKSNKEAVSTLNDKFDKVIKLLEGNKTKNDNIRTDKGNDADKR